MDSVHVVYKHGNWMNDVEGSGKVDVKEFAARRTRAKGWTIEHIIHNHDLLAELVRRDPIRYG